MKHFTYSDFNELTDDENHFNKLLRPKRNEEVEAPSKTSINNILAYSKALSVRKSSSIDFIENVLN